MLKKFSVIFLSLSLFALVHASNLDFRVNLGKKEATYEFSKLEKLTFKDGKLVVTADGKEKAHSLDDVKFMKFGESTVGTMYSGVLSQNLKVTVQGANLQISGLSTAAKINVYNLQGNLVHSLNAEQNIANLSLNQFKSGLYICKIRGNGINYSSTFVVK
ncbi:MAG: T9SS type A sorting domain-containing protein [Fibrobacter sp.]|nr:T9SS type A sorting domain-containing protein [Fibrobacter sp.]